MLYTLPSVWGVVSLEPRLLEFDRTLVYFILNMGWSLDTVALALSYEAADVWTRALCLDIARLRIEVILCLITPVEVDFLALYITEDELMKFRFLGR